MMIKHRYRALKVVGVLAGSLVLATLTACTTSHVLVGNPRPPISPEQVRIYLQPPAKYEEIAFLDSSSRGSLAMTAQGRTDKVIERLKKEAASLGANGVVLQGVADQGSGSVGTGFATATTSGKTAHGVGAGASTVVFQKSGSGTAIYVPPDPTASR